jgi:predicted GNAT family acetyltransferase
MRHEAQNMIPLGNLMIGYEGKDKTGWRDPAHWLMAAVSDGTEIRLVALMTPPYNLTLYAAENQINDAALDCLVDALLEAGAPVPGVVTEKTLAEAFARTYCAAAGLDYATGTRQRIYELREVNPAVPSGQIRLAMESDMAFLPYWCEGFASDCFGSPFSVQTDPEPYRYLISAGNLYILMDGDTPVSMAKITRELQTVCGVGYVYTPPYFRGKGYATACVAALSRLILDRGFASCVLYTDLANPTSNSIYQKIGYRPLCDSLEIKFHEKA